MDPSRREWKVLPLQQNSLVKPKRSQETYEDEVTIVCEEEMRFTAAEKPVEESLPRHHDRKNVEQRLWTALSLTGTVSSLRSVSYLLLPSFVQRYLNESRAYHKREVYPTTYLNGIRGLAALIVYCQHFASDYYFWVHRGYLAHPGDVYFIQWPIIRLIISGRFMVVIFFILSGYVLSYRPVKLIRQNKPSALLENLAFSTFRRAPRLFLPCLPPMLIVGVAKYYGVYYVQGPPLRQTKFSPMPSLLPQLWAVCWEFFQMTNPFTEVPFIPVATPQLWTLGMEFRGSMIVFILLLCLARIKNVIRISLLLVFTFYSMCTTHWETSLFVIGILFSEYRCTRDNLNISYPTSRRSGILRLETVKSVFSFVLLVLGMHLGSWPTFEASISPGYRFLATLTPDQYRGDDSLQQYFWLTLAAAMLLLAFESLPMLQAPFTTTVGVYFGEISFAFYIVHWPILYTFGRWTTVGLIHVTGSFHVGFWLGALITTPIVICVADLWWRWGDVKLVALARWAARKCSVKT